MARPLPTTGVPRHTRRHQAAPGLPRVLTLLLALVLVGAGETPGATDTGDTSQASRPIAAGLGEVLGGGGPYATPDLSVRLISQEGDILDLDKLVGDRPTLLFYFSANCSHCSQVAPELVRLARRLEGTIDVLGIASGSNGLDDISRFQAEQKLPFPVHKDFSRRFASRNKAVSTPTVLLVRRAPGGFETLAEFRPFYAGASLPAEIRILAVVGLDPWGAFETGRYNGAKACGSCHREEYRSWGLTHHSVAYWTLYERKETGRPECVKCHVTGFDEPGGFALGDDGSSRADVTCEACHGAGGPHAPGHDRSAAPAASSLCVTCHDQDHSIHFALERALPAIDHFRAAPMDESTFQQARQDLLEGRAPKPLLAFPEGRNLGSQACAGCHRAEHRHWSRSRHARAMKTLAQRDATSDLNCVGCHAVTRKTPPESVDDFHPDSVSCEACHGPGEQHVAAGGGKANIVGLGESCPECVIESICTRCHTPEQDPDWDLKTALDAVRHGH